MKKFMLIALAGLLGLSAAAATKDDLRIYINPGHGSWTANDRPMPVKGHGPYSKTNTDTTSFFESNTNLRKGFGVLEKLRAMGLKFNPELNQTGERHTIGAARDMSNNIVMSHVKLGPYHDDNGASHPDNNYYNRSLPEIAAEVDANNFDMFISIHSNAVDNSGWKTLNFPIILYRGYDDCHGETGVDATTSAQCKAMAQKAWPYHMQNTHECWTSYSPTNPNIRGDINFYGSSSTVRGYKGYLGVLKHGVPGFLVEGYFHQYAPAALRHMNWDVNYIEGFNYAHGIADYFGLQKESVGDIYGIVRDEHERYVDESYIPVPTHADAYMPLDAVTVTLKKGNQVVDTYTTDNQFNGAFVFYNVAPGTYTIETSKEGYISPEPVEVTVTAANVSYPAISMTSETWTPPVITYTDYPDELVGTQFGPRGEYAFEQAIVDKEIAELEGTTLRRMLCVGGKLYILAHKTETEPVIVVLDAKTLNVLAVPGVEGAEGTEQPIADIAVTADGVLLASAKELCQFDASQVRDGETRGECNVYRWENSETGVPEGNPVLWVSTMLSGNFYRAYSGGAMAYTGTYNEGKIILSAQNANSGGKVFYSFINIMDGTKMSEGISNNSYFNHEECGPFTLNISPLNAEHVIADSPTFLPLQIDIPGKVLAAQMPEGIVPAEGTAPGFFRYAGKVYMVSTDNDANGNGGIMMVDITNGIDNAELVPTVNTSLDAAEGFAAAAGMQLTTRDDYDRVNSANIALFLARGNKVTRFTTEGVRQPQPRREFAYGIALEENDGDYTVTFNSTGDAVAANIVLTNNEDENDVVMIPAGAVAKGENSATFNRADLAGHFYSVAVAIQSKPIGELGEYYSDPNGVTKRGGVITITDPEFDSFGYTLVTTGGANGVKVYAPDGTVTGPFLVSDPRLSTSNQSSMFRGDQRDGMAVFADWSDEGAGYWVIDPLNPTEMYQLLGGERSGTKGSYAYNGTIIGGGSSCVAFQGTGENTRMYSFLEDYPAGNTPGAQQMIYRYDIGTDYQITKVPDVAFENLSGAVNLSNQNVEICCTPDGFFATQKRTAGNNLAGVAGFYYVANSGEILFSSHVLDDIVSTNAAIAISRDLKYLAVGEYDRVDVFNVEWTDGEPSFTLMATVDNPAAGDDFAHMRFDAGNNLHVYHRLGEGYHAYSLPDAAPTSVVPAKSIYVVEGSNTGVEDIVIEENGADAAAVYYNLSGVRVSGTLTPGIYIKVVGDEASKVVIR